MQTIDGDEFISDKECIRLLDCNKSKWGDTENHYDLVRLTIQQICKTKTYIRRSECQQIEYQKQEDRKITDRHRQTLIGEEQTKHVHYQDSDKLRPEEDVSRMRDCTARRKHDEKNKKKDGRLYKQEKEEGTRITSTNLSGSQFDFEYMLEH
eukprot:6482070-Heterocapsa_arctica.AAC.1